MDSGAVCAQSTTARTASGAETARMTASNGSLFTRHWLPVAAMRSARVPSLTSPPRWVIQSAAACGNSADKSVRGSSRLEPPRAPKSESRSTRRKTWALARSAGVLRADTHNGSISSAITRGLTRRHKDATLVCGGQWNPASCQPVLAASSDHLSFRLQPCAPHMPARASQGDGQSGRVNPPPSGNRSISGRRSKASSGFTPT